MSSTSFPPTRPGCGRWRRDAAVAAAGRTVGTGPAAWSGLGGAAGRSVVLAGRLALRGAGRAGSTGAQDDPGDAGPADAAGTRCGGRAVLAGCSCRDPGASRRSRPPPTPSVPCARRMAGCTSCPVKPGSRRADTGSGRSVRTLAGPRRAKPSAAPPSTCACWPRRCPRGARPWPGGARAKANWPSRPMAGPGPRCRCRPPPSNCCPSTCRTGPCGPRSATPVPRATCACSRHRAAAALGCRWTLIACPRTWRPGGGHARCPCRRSPRERFHPCRHRLLNMDLNTWLAPVAPECPCGEDLSFSEDFDRLRELRREDDTTLSQGEWVSPLKRADWPAVLRACDELLVGRSKDLRLAGWWTEAAWHLHGFDGLADGLERYAALIQAHWPTLHPQCLDDGMEPRLGSLDLLQHQG